MNRIDETFARLRREGRRGLVGYLTAGAPDGETSEARIRVAVEAGLDVLELGMPFSDPTADGPTIQAASFRALSQGMTVEKMLGLVRSLRADYGLPIVLFGYINPIFRYGYERFCAAAADAGADAVLVVDLPHEESAPLREALERHGLYWVPLVAPTTPSERMRTLLADARGFVYYIMVTGVTGTRHAVAAEVQVGIARVRACTTLPIAVGFGVENGAQAREVGAGADAVVVGSALLRAAQDGTRLEALVRELRESCAS